MCDFVFDLPPTAERFQTLEAATPDFSKAWKTSHPRLPNPGKPHSRTCFLPFCVVRFHSRARRRSWLTALLLPFFVFCIAASAADPMVVVLPVKNAATHEMLRERLNEPDAADRMEALDALACIGDPADHERILARLADSYARVRAEALRALARRGESADDATLERLATDDSALVRAAVFAYVPDAFFRERPERVATGLADTEFRVRAAAAQRAAFLNESAEAFWSRITREPEPAVRERLLRARAATLEDPARAALLRAALDGTDRVLRQTALECLSPEDADFAAAALALAERERGAVAAAAFAALARLRPPGTVALLIRRWETESDPALWPPLCAALGTFDTDPAVVAALAKALRGDRGHIVHQTAAAALEKLTAPEVVAAVTAAAGDKDARVRAAVARILGGRSEPAAAATLWRMLDDAEPSVLAAALEALHRRGAPRDGARLDRVRSLENHENAEVVAGAIRLRGDLGDRDAIPALARRLHNLNRESHPAPRAAALEALIALGHAGEAPRAIELAAKKVIPSTATNPEPTPDHIAVRRAALRYLERFGDAAAAEELLAAFDDVPPPELRPDIARAVSRMTGRPYRALPDYSYRAYSVESLEEPSHPAWPPIPGVAPE